MKIKNNKNINLNCLQLICKSLCFCAAVAVLSCGNDSDSSVDTNTGTDTDTDTDTDTKTDTIDISEIISDIDVEVHDEVNTILVVSWSQTEDLDEVWIKYTFEDDEWFETPAGPREEGNNEQLILGIPGKTKVTMHIVVKQGEAQDETEAFEGTTDAVPSAMPTPFVRRYNESIVSPNKWLFGSVNDTEEEGMEYYGPFWLYIIDRKGRIVWYYADLADTPIVGFPRISRDNRYIFFGNRTPWSKKKAKDFTPTVVKMTLDRSYFEEIEIPLTDNVDMTDDGSLLFNTAADLGDYSDSWLQEYTVDKEFKNIWNCSEVFGSDCYSNSVNWNPIDNTVVMSFPYLNTVVEIDREKGEIVGQYGDAKGSYAFAADDIKRMIGFDFQHYANITPDGTLMVSSHLSNIEKHAFMEFDIDRENEVLTSTWIYREGEEWPDAMGEAHKIPNGNGNVIANYGTAGVIKEITPNKSTAWYVEWGTGLTPDKMVGHCILFDDIYAINRGPEE